MPIQKIEVSEREQRALELVAELMGVSVDAAATILAKECIERRMQKRSAQVLPFAPRVKA